MHETVSVCVVCVCGGGGGGGGSMWMDACVLACLSLSDLFTMM